MLAFLEARDLLPRKDGVWKLGPVTMRMVAALEKAGRTPPDWLVLVALAAALGVFFTTFHGQTLWKFIQGARVELRKVVWPTRQETLQTTMVVLFFVVLMAVFFFLLDKVLFWATGLLTGQGG